MIGPDHTREKHVSNELLIKLLDDELIGEETGIVESHLADCGACRERFGELRHVSNRFDSLVSSSYPAYSFGERQQLSQSLDSVENKTRKAERRWGKKQMGWALTVAASLMFGLILLPRGKEAEHTLTERTGASQTASAFEVDGETFVPLPYSNPDLSSNAPHIVQMQVPVSSLAEAGVYFEPLGSRISTPDRAVLADVLLGLDGQPLGVHVFSSD